MLKQLRKGAAGFFAKALLFMLVLSFALWGIGDIVNSRSANPVASVGDAKITQAEFEKEIAFLQRTFGEAMPSSGINLLNIYRMTLNDMIGRKLLTLEAGRLGLSIPEDSLAQQISRNDAFRSPSGEFDKILFQQTLRQNSLNESEYLGQLRNGLQQSLLLDIMNAQAVTPPGYAHILYTINNELRTVDLLAVDEVPEKAEQEPGEDEIAAFYEAHQTTFTAPEFRRLEIIRIQPSKILEEIKVSRQELFDLYNARAEALMIPEKREVVQLLYATKAEAENAYGMLRSGKSYTQVAEMLPPANSDALELGLITREQMPAGADQVFSLSKEEYTQPIESPFGWHVFFIKGIEEKHSTPFDDVKKTLEEELRQQKGESLLMETVEQLEDALAGTQTLADAAKQAELPLTVTEPVSRQGTGSDHREILSAPEDQALLETAFALPQGERSELMHLPDGGYYVVKVDEVMPPRQRTLDEVRGQVLSEWKNEQRQQARKRYALDLVKELKSAETVEAAKKIVAEHKLSVTPDVPVRRNGTVIGIEGVHLPPPLVKDIFALEKAGLPSSAHTVGNEGYVVALLKKIEPAEDPEASKEGGRQLQALRRSLRKDYENEVLQQYIDHLKTRYPVTVNDALLAQLAESR